MKLLNFCNKRINNRNFINYQIWNQVSIKSWEIIKNHIEYVIENSIENTWRTIDFEISKF